MIVNWVVSLFLYVLLYCPASTTVQVNKQGFEGKKRFSGNWKTFRCVGLVFIHFPHLFLPLLELFHLVFADDVDVI